MATSAGSLDANVLLRLILRDIPTQSDSALVLLRHSGLFDIADTAIIETVFALERYYEIPRSDIATYIEAVISHPKLKLSKELMLEAISIYPSHPKLSFEDCYLAVHARIKSAQPLWTFDKKLATQLSGMARIV